MLARVFRLPPGRDTWPAGIAILLQILAAAALFVIVRDQRPNPRLDPEAWEQMGLLVEFFSILSPAMLVTVVACAAFHAFDPSLSAAQRSAECAVILKLFAVGVVLVELELLYFGYSKGFWKFFGGMGAVTFLDLVLVFLVFRYLDCEQATEDLHHSPTGPRHL